MCKNATIYNCKKYNGNRNCIECEEGMEVVNGRCKEKVEYYVGLLQFI